MTQHGIPDALEKAAAALAQAEGRTWQPIGSEGPTREQAADLMRARAVVSALIPKPGQMAKIMDGTMLDAALAEVDEYRDTTDPGAFVDGFDAALRAITDHPIPEPELSSIDNTKPS